jgi:nicotinamidase-related amidase
MQTLKLSASTSQLVVIDIQPKLCGVMDADSVQSVINNTALLLQAARLCEVPVIATEQYPQGLGETSPEIKLHLDPVQPIAKTAFSACDEPKFNQHLHRDRPQVVITGMEAHICVLQTALDLLAAGKQVFIVEDAIISRKENNRANAVARMRQAGCIITNTESVLFEHLRNAQHPAFKTISKLIR